MVRLFFLHEAESGFVENPFIENDEQNNGSGNICYNRSTLVGLVIWQGNLNRTPRGWEMPIDARPLKIGVPGRTTFDKFVKVEYREKPNENRYDGFCIQIFYKTYDDVIGDILIYTMLIVWLLEDFSSLFFAYKADAAQLAETFTEAKCSTKVVGVPVTLNGDLKNQFVEANVGFDTICKVDSQLISNVCTDALMTLSLVIS
ncbi:Pyrophosphate--fructose 6-phosphate 1-phosphotransferase subunit alpha [Morella rubra]|uniref:Pyrophosphate--fructose 6-phosphate 1-phosphotransferase subunit alpha n=1 Tax=Morella rubra TaxID=262757 RepID=A0A6A1USN9_9ROSI|nr:Pyrophosphate--fructose 6-phosphate 1-phosphotransferase subunit alpha [Morella rubra]